MFALSNAAYLNYLLQGAFSFTKSPCSNNAMQQTRTEIVSSLALALI